MVISLRALCIGRRQAMESHLTRFRSMQLNSRKSILLIRYKTKYVTKQSVIRSWKAAGCWWLQLPRLKPTYTFLVRMINFRDNRTVPLVRLYVHTHWNTTDFIHAILALILKGSVVILYRVTIQKHFPDRTKEVRIT